MHKKATTTTKTTMEDNSTVDQTWLPRENMDRLYISAPQAPPRLPGPPTFGPCSNRSRSNNSKQVHFEGAQIVSIIKAGSEMSPEERHELWYSTEDLDGYKIAARTMSRKLQNSESATVPNGDTGTEKSPYAQTMNASICPPSNNSLLQDCLEEEGGEKKGPIAATACSTKSSSSSTEMVDEEEEGEESRGLEHRVCVNRQRHKYLAIRCTLKAQMQSRCPDFIARISSKCTQWSRDLAIAEGERDFCEAYCPQNVKTRKTLQNDCPILNFFRRATKRGHDGERCLPSIPAAESEDVCTRLIDPPNQKEEGVAVSPSPCGIPSSLSSSCETTSSCLIDRCVRQKCCKDSEKDL